MIPFVTFADALNVSDAYAAWVATPCNKPLSCASVFSLYYYPPMMGEVGFEPTSPFSLGFWYRL